MIAYLDDSYLKNKSNLLNANVVKNKAKLAQIQVQTIAVGTQNIAEANKSDRSIQYYLTQLQNTQTEYQQKQITTQAKLQESKAQLNIAKPI